MFDQIDTKVFALALGRFDPIDKRVFKIALGRKDPIDVSVFTDVFKRFEKTKGISKSSDQGYFRPPLKTRASSSLSNPRITTSSLQTATNSQKRDPIDKRVFKIALGRKDPIDVSVFTDVFKRFEKTKDISKSRSDQGYFRLPLKTRASSSLSNPRITTSDNKLDDNREKNESSSDILERRFDQIRQEVDRELAAKEKALLQAATDSQKSAPFLFSRSFQEETDEVSTPPSQTATTDSQKSASFLFSSFREENDEVSLTPSTLGFSPHSSELFPSNITEELDCINASAPSRENSSSISTNDVNSNDVSLALNVAQGHFQNSTISQTLKTRTTKRTRNQRSSKSKRRKISKGQEAQELSKEGSDELNKDKSKTKTKGNMLQVSRSVRDKYIEPNVSVFSSHTI